MYLFVRLFYTFVVLPAFTPTSVIRKMANEKAEAKENGKDDDRESNTPTVT